VVVGGVETSGIYWRQSQGLAAELTVSAPATVFCATGSEGAAIETGTSFGEPLSGYISLAFDDIGRGNLATPAVAGLAAYFMSLDQYRVQLQVQGYVARNVRDLIKSLAYARLPLQPAVVWNGIDSREYLCPVRRDAGSSGCPARNTTIVPPAHGTTLPSSSKISSFSIVTGLSATSSGSSNSPPSSMTPIVSTTSHESGVSLMISPTTIIESGVTTSGSISPL
jgi:hypothetical protein